GGGTGRGVVARRPALRGGGDMARDTRRVARGIGSRADAKGFRNGAGRYRRRGVRAGVGAGILDDVGRGDPVCSHRPRPSDGCASSMTTLALPVATPRPGRSAAERPVALKERMMEMHARESLERSGRWNLSFEWLARKDVAWYILGGLLIALV